MSLVTAKFVQSVTFETTMFGVQAVSYEADNLTFGFEQIGEQYTFLDDSEEVVFRGFRFVMGFQSRYMRKADGNSGGITDVINISRLPGVTTKVRIDGIGMPFTEVYFPIENRLIGVRRQRIIPAFDFSLRAKEKEEVMPEWFRFTKDAPGYLTV